METRRLFYEDCHKLSFSARVLECRAGEKGFFVVPDQTAFYPEGGGQPNDTGTLGGVRVLDVREKEGRIVHLCGGPLMLGQRVEGLVDADRRFDLMQQHTGEHIVSGIICGRLGYHNVGFHIGSETVTVDFDGPLTPEELEQVEVEANRFVWANVPVRCWFPGPEEQVSYRSKRALDGPVRVVEVPGADRCACCGVHVAATGEIGLIRLFSVVKFHQGSRIEMACGKRALDYLNAVYQQNKRVSQAFSAKPLETGAAAERMNEALAREKYRAAGLFRALAEEKAKAYAGEALALCFMPGLSAGECRVLARAISEQADTAAVFSGEADTYQVCLAGKDTARLGKDVAASLRGRGGGRDGFFQGTVRGSEGEIRAFFQKRKA